MSSCSYFLYLYMVFIDTIFTLFIEQFQYIFHHYNLKFIILNSYEHFKLIEFNPQLNLVESFRTHFS